MIPLCYLVHSTRVSESVHSSPLFFTNLVSGSVQDLLFSSTRIAGLHRHLDVDAWTFAFARNLSHVALSAMSGATIPARTLAGYSAGPPMPVSKVPLLPAIAFVVNTALFCACVLFICAWTKTAGPILGDRKGRPVKAVRLAQLRLTSPAALIYEHFCARSETSIEISGSSNADTLLKFDGSEELRIRMGVIESMDSGGDPDESESFRFGMSTGPIGDRMQRPDQVQDTIVL